ncbi:MAG: M1 family peptidase, partial [Bacteroidetes bacterium]
MMKRVSGLLIGVVLLSTAIFAQDPVFTRQDTLRGSITPERAWWDLTYYHLSVNVNPTDSSFTGSNLVGYRVIETSDLMQIDLQPPMQIISISQDGVKQKFTKDGNAWFVQLNGAQNKGDIKYLQIEFGGKPQISKRPPWEGGVSWGKDRKGNPFI